LISEHRIRRSVRFYETDAAGIVHFSWFNRYMEEAEHALWRAAGMSIAGAADRNIGWPRVAAAFDFKRPLKFEDEFEIWIRITAIKEKTITYGCMLIKDDVLMASGSMTIACAEKLPNGTIKSRPIPDDIAVRFAIAEALEPDA
jgi:acyl-CoA thioester hydrolase